MNTNALNVGCGLIATAPVFAGHIVLLKHVRYMLLSWFCSFISTVILVICSLSSLFTINPWYVLLFSVPLDALGKVVLKFFACKFRFLSKPVDRCSLGLSCGLGFALAHVLTMYLPIVFDQPYSVFFDDKHPDYFPNCLDLALVYQALSVFHMGVSLIIYRFDKMNIFLMFLIAATLQYAASSITQIPIIWVKQIIINLVSYALLIFGLISFRSMEYSQINDDLLKAHDE
ncbi:hypothetical protein TRFO_21415 [Tritrichomonas foetus]|uniref:Transmembrane protein n=1 Tax=Tritrichomonas foetus TaxID=1144522 RepID=A0A1J4KFA7_9EUKA|nr:hypothetical protein TRFO_21415 [Tritrichomonas foetus]|eukprot:OHT09616.1 hypothetical protein TRFO_21415 [Tritrichomonas foetus]